MPNLNVTPTKVGAYASFHKLDISRILAPHRPDLR
jgi:hypothetical protein